MQNRTDVSAVNIFLYISASLTLSYRLSSQTSGLSEYMGTVLARLDFMSTPGIVITFSIITAFVTEFASNSAVASVLLPICAQLVR